MQTLINQLYTPSENPKGEKPKDLKKVESSIDMPEKKKKRKEKDYKKSKKKKKIEEIKIPNALKGMKDNEIFEKIETSMEIYNYQKHQVNCGYEDEKFEEDTKKKGLEIEEYLNHLRKIGKRVEFENKYKEIYEKYLEVYCYI
jgi:hypothetical protein